MKSRNDRKYDKYQVFSMHSGEMALFAIHTAICGLIVQALVAPEAIEGATCIALYAASLTRFPPKSQLVLAGESFTMLVETVLRTAFPNQMELVAILFRLCSII